MAQAQNWREAMQLLRGSEMAVMRRAHGTVKQDKSIAVHSLSYSRYTLRPAQLLSVRALYLSLANTSALWGR